MPRTMRVEYPGANRVSPRCHQALPSLSHRIRLDLLCLVLVGSGWPAAAQAIDPVFTFGNSNSLSAWSVSWGNPNPTLSWDGTLDSRSNAVSGALTVVENFTGAPMEFFAANGLFLDGAGNPVLVDAYRYQYLALDLKVAPGIAPSTNGAFGSIELGVFKTNWSHVPYGTLAVPLSATNWTHLLVPVNFQAGTEVSGLAGLYFQVGSWFSNFTNTLTLHVDNFGFGGGFCCAPPPSFSIEPAVPGPGLWLSWPVQWPGCHLQAATNLQAGDWHDTGLETNAVSGGDLMRLFVPPSALPSDAAGFWRLRVPSP